VTVTSLGSIPSWEFARTVMQILILLHALKSQCRVINPGLVCWRTAVSGIRVALTVFSLYGFFL